VVAIECLLIWRCQQGGQLSTTCHASQRYVTTWWAGVNAGGGVIVCNQAVSADLEVPVGDAAVSRMPLRCLEVCVRLLRHGAGGGRPGASVHVNAGGGGL
jgi:hypothetical protein